MTFSGSIIQDRRHQKTFLFMYNSQIISICLCYANSESNRISTESSQGQEKGISPGSPLKHFVYDWTDLKHYKCALHHLPVDMVDIN